MTTTYLSIRSYSDSEKASLKRKASQLDITPTGIESTTARASYNQEEIMMKIPRNGRWRVSTVKSIAKTHFLENSTLATAFIVVLLLVSCGAANGTGSSPPQNPIA
jgi:hypothetical protein